MRWGVHWRIGRDSLHGRESLMFQLGTILPDWFERHPIHRRKESLGLIAERIVRLREMQPGRKRDWYLGTVAHFLCDYCCMAHNEEYYRFYRHRVYEVESQKYYKRVRAERKPRYVAAQLRFLEQAKRLHPALFDGTLSDDDFRGEMLDLINSAVLSLHRKIEALNTAEWWTDLRVAELDVRYSYYLIHAVLTALHAHGTEGGNAYV
jgi:hypothetical protein